jgi:HAD superfamily hydrolase (TIGR01484 family)
MVPRVTPGPPAWHVNPPITLATDPFSMPATSTSRPTASPPLSLTRAPPGTFSKTRGILFDVDDTVTTHGTLHAATYAALEAAQKSGLWMCAVTGRGAGWCDLMARLWPVDAVVGETGAFAYVRRKDGTVEELFLRDEATRQKDVQRRDAAVADVLRQVKGSRLSRDSAFRICDVAFDLKEDGPPLGEPAVQDIMALLLAAGLTVARSSVHINTWVGDYTKAHMVDVLMRRTFGERFNAGGNRFVYVGDSRNDGPMFAAFRLSVGVANVAGVLPELTAKGQAPAFITRGAMGKGTTELVRRVLKDRREGGDA